MIGNVLADELIAVADGLIADDPTDGAARRSISTSDLQANRERADYALGFRESSRLAPDFASRARTAIEDWRRIRGTADARIFILLLLRDFSEPRAGR